LAFRCPATEFAAKRESTELKEGQMRLDETELGAAIRANTYEEQKKLRFIVEPEPKFWIIDESVDAIHKWLD